LNSTNVGTWQNHCQFRREPGKYGAMQAMKGFSDSDLSASSDPANLNSYGFPTTMEGNGGVSFK
jgi:hypothetical protein